MANRSPLAYLASNVISLIGVVLVNTAGVLWLLTLPAFWRGEASSPYIGILLFLILPGVFAAGLVLIPVGIALHIRKRRKAGDIGPLILQGGLQRLLVFVGVTTMANLMLGSQFSYRAVTYMENDKFCGQACHTVMNPEYTAHANSPHARVACTECHVGGGASFFVKAKLSGTRQLVMLLFNTYPRPIPTPVHQLRPAAETCGQCHSPRQFGGEKLFVHTEYAADEQNAASTTVAMMKIGGHNLAGAVGIHGAHADAQGRMEYIATDQHRQVIPQVTYTDGSGKVTVFNSSDAPAKPEDLARGEHREMDCTDCHNRATHIFQVPERALDLAMTQGGISPKLPFIKRQAAEALRHEYPDRATAVREIAASLEKFYRTNYPSAYAADSVLLKSAIGTVQSIYERNVFPEMRITWGSYPNNLGHTDYPGCFRCHDGNHTSAGGRTISNDCATCHDLLAVSEKDPKILTELGMSSPQAAVSGSAAANK